MENEFGGRYKEIYGTWRTITNSGDKVGEVKSFKYLRLFTQRKEGFVMDVKHKI